MHKIDDTNYDGYLMLYQNYTFIRTNLIKKSFIKILSYLITSLIIGLISFEILTYLIFLLPLLLIEISIDIIKDKKKIKKEIKQKYPDIDINININELENLLDNYVKKDTKIYEIKRTKEIVNQNIFYEEEKEKVKKLVKKK
jgi:hypothetical protein